MSERQTSPWWYVLAGCGGCLVVVVAIVMIGALATFRWAREIESTTKDPSARAERVLEILNAERLPPGYYPAFVLHVAFLIDLAVLSDEEVGPLGDGHDEEGMHIKERGFIYLNAIRAGDSKQEIDDFLAGRSDDLSILDDNDIGIEANGVVSSGDLDLPGQPLRYVAQRGRLRIQKKRLEGIATIMVLKCGDNRLRTGIWFGPAPKLPIPVEATGSDASEAPIPPLPPEAYKGTPADPVAIAEFMSYFKLCESN